MSAPHAAEHAATSQPKQPKTAVERLTEIRRSLQRLARRKLNAHEQNALEHCALLMLRSEMALRDPSSDANSVVRLSNAARRAMEDFRAIVAPQKREPSYEALGL